ncbi:MAG: PEP-CTERM sorting domain-containing protein [Armatimonadetes bacterium]|nr:PEP-CTERM sorting domain-containing protein [Armatimonadota bacterium]
MRTVAIVLGSVLGSAALAAPLTPNIFGHDFNFGAFNSKGPFEYMTNGVAPDTLTYTMSSLDTEVTAYWPFWPAPPVFPVLNLGGVFGGDFELYVEFSGQDAPYVGPGGTLDVSLTGTGANAGGPDLMIWGSIPGAAPPGLLWALELDVVSLYGYSNFDAYVLEGAGTIVGGLIAERNNLIGEPGVMRGHLDFLDRPAGWIPPLYDTTEDVQLQLRAAYSGETGWGVPVPEPATLLALVVGGLGLLARRRRR